MEPGAGTVPDRDAQLSLATGRVSERHVDDLPRVGELQGGGEQHRGIHTAQTTPPSSPTGMAYPHQTAKGLNMIDSKDSLLAYLAADRLVQPEPKNPLKRLFGARVVCLKTHLRKAEYHHNIGGVASSCLLLAPF